MGKRIVMGVIVSLLFSMSVCLAGEKSVYVINHVFTDAVYRVNGMFVLNGSPALGFKLPAGVNAATVTYDTLDQVMLSKGRHIIYAKIIDLTNDKEIKKTKASMIEADVENYKYGHNVKWNYTTERGLFGYQLVVDDEVVGTFAITIN